MTPDGPAVRFEGRDTKAMMSLIADMATYLSGPGLDPFLEWIDAQYPEIRLMNRKSTRATLENLAAQTEQAFTKLKGGNR